MGDSKTFGIPEAKGLRGKKKVGELGSQGYIRVWKWAEPEFYSY